MFDVPPETIVVLEAPAEPGVEVPKHKLLAVSNFRLEAPTEKSAAPRYPTERAHEITELTYHMPMASHEPAQTGPVDTEKVAEAFPDDSNTTLTHAVAMKGPYKGYRTVRRLRLLMHMGDAFTTIYAIENKNAVEANPIARAVIGKRPTPGAVVAYKAAFAGVQELISHHFDKTAPKFSKYFDITSTVLTGGVVAANARFMF